MSERHLSPGTKILFGVPVTPMPAIMADAIGLVVAQVSGIREAYLPQCFIEGDSEARQVLVIGVNKSSSISEIVEELMAKLQLLLPMGQFIDIIPYPTSSMPAGARVGQCRIFLAKNKPWWKLW